MKELTGVVVYEIPETMEKVLEIFPN